MASSLAKCVSIVATAVALATAVPSVAYSQSTNPDAAPRPAQNQPASPSNRPSAGQDLNLSTQQRERIQSILVNRQQQIEAVLTKEQRDRIVEAQRSGQQISPQTLNLTSDQINRIRQIVQSSNDQIKQVLTPEQIQQLQNQSN
jgi:periplasmic protein CpxP/Spy